MFWIKQTCDKTFLPYATWSNADLKEVKWWLLLKNSGKSLNRLWDAGRDKTSDHKIEDLHLKLEENVVSLVGQFLWYNNQVCFWQPKFTERRERIDQMEGIWFVIFVCQTVYFVVKAHTFCVCRMTFHALWSMKIKTTNTECRILAVPSCCSGVSELLDVFYRNITVACLAADNLQGGAAVCPVGCGQTDQLPAHHHHHHHQRVESGCSVMLQSWEGNCMCLV